MLIFIIMLVLGLLSFLLWVGFKLTGALLSACIWLFVKVPIALVLGLLGVVFCCTLILIPVGVKLVKSGIKFLF